LVSTPSGSNLIVNTPPFFSYTSCHAFKLGMGSEQDAQYSEQDAQYSEQDAQYSEQDAQYSEQDARTTARMRAIIDIKV